VWYFVDRAHRIFAAVTRLKSALTNLFEPGFVLLDDLLSLDVMTLPQPADVRSDRTVYRRNSALPELLTSEDQCDKFVKASKRTGQQHIVNFITQNGGQKHWDIVTLMIIFIHRNSTVAYSRRK